MFKGELGWGGERYQQKQVNSEKKILILNVYLIIQNIT